MIGVNRRRVMVAKNDAIPYDKIEYLQTNGVDSQYIQLPITVQEGLDIYCEFMIVESTNYGYIFGNQESSQNYLIVRQLTTSGKIQVALAPKSALVNESVAHLNQLRDIDVHLWNGEQYAKLDNIAILDRNETYSNNTNFKINLWNRTMNNMFTSKVRIYSFSVFLHDELVLDLTPVKDNGIGYMYDKVSGQLFGNSGTGDFVLGNDK